MDRQFDYVVAGCDRPAESWMELQAGFRAARRSRARNICRHSSRGVRRGGQEGLSAVFLAGRARSHRRFTAAKAVCRPAVGAAFHLWTGLVDCVRKPGQPDAGQGRCAAARDGFAADAWGLAPAAHPAVAGGEPAACAERCGHWHRAGPRAGQGSDCVHWQRAGSCFSSHLSRSSGSVFHVWSGAVDLRAVWSGARDPGGQCRSRDGDEGKRTRVDRGTRTLPAAQRTDRFAGCALSGAAGCGPAVCSHLQEPAQSGCWISTEQCSRRGFRFFASQGCYRQSPGIQARAAGEGEEYAGSHCGGGDNNCSVERRWMERVHRYSERVDLTQAGVLQCSEHRIFSDAANPHDRRPRFQRKRYSRFAA